MMEQISKQIPGEGADDMPQDVTAASRAGDKHLPRGVRGGRGLAGQDFRPGTPRAQGKPPLREVTALDRGHGAGRGSRYRAGGSRRRAGVTAPGGGSRRRACASCRCGARGSRPLPGEVAACLDPGPDSG